MTLIVWLPAMPPEIEVGWLFGSATKLTRLFALNVTASAVKSTPVLLYWLDSHTYGVRPANRARPPRICDRFSPPVLRYQLKPARAENIFGAGTTSVAKPKALSASGFACGLSGNCGASNRTP